LAQARPEPADQSSAALSGGSARLVVQADRALEAELRRLGTRRMVLLAGLAGTGKSFLVHQLAHLAMDAGRRIHLLQWDVARPRLEASPAGRRYPLADGVTHPMIRRAAGRWVRHVIGEWHERHPEPRHLLIGEAPLIGNRFSELAHRVDDAAEPLLAGSSCRFVIAVPSAPVRAFLEAERDRRTAHPLHPREREDAPPQVLRDLWHDLVAPGGPLGMGSASGETTAQDKAGDPPPARLPYDPVSYQQAYASVLRHRHVEIVRLDTVLPTEALSVYDFAQPLPDLLPTEAETERFIGEAEQDYPYPAALERDIATWWRV
jgi:hypothetical protein